MEKDTFNVGDTLSYDFNPKRIMKVKEIIDGVYYFEDGSYAPVEVSFTLVNSDREKESR